MVSRQTCGTEERRSSERLAGSSATASSRMVLLLVPLVCWACQGGRTANQEVANRVAQSLPCLSRDSLQLMGGELVFSSRRAARVTGDIVGQEVRLRPGDSGWSGTYVTFVGGPIPIRPPRELAVKFDLASSVIEFDNRTTPGLNHLRGSFTCDSIFGELTKPGVKREEVLRRLRDST